MGLGPSKSKSKSKVKIWNQCAGKHTGRPWAKRSWAVNPAMKAPPNNRFLKSEPHYPHELRGEAKLSCKNKKYKNFEKFLLY